MEQLICNNTQQSLSNLMKKSMAIIQQKYFFSLLFFSSSLGFLLFHTIKPNLSIFPLFSYDKFSIDRNHMFLICNGILVILVKSSSSSTTTSIDKDIKFDELQKETELGCEKKCDSMLESKEHSFVDDNVGFLSVESNASEVKTMSYGDNHDHDQSSVFYDDDHDGNDNVDDDEEDEDGLDREDLNKRCEDFIRKMKQGIIYESRKDAILVRFS